MKYIPVRLVVKQETESSKAVDLKIPDITKGDLDKLFKEEGGPNESDPRVD